MSAETNMENLQSFAEYANRHLTSIYILQYVTACLGKNSMTIKTHRII